MNLGHYCVKDKFDFKISLTKIFVIIHSDINLAVINLILFYYIIRNINHFILRKDVILHLYIIIKTIIVPCKTMSSKIWQTKFILKYITTGMYACARDSQSVIIITLSVMSQTRNEYINLFIHG